MSRGLDRVRQAARQDRTERFTALLHHIDVDLLRTAFFALKRGAAPGVDGVAWRDYETDLKPRLWDLHGRVQRGAYRAQPARRRSIPKGDGRDGQTLSVQAEDHHESLEIDHRAAPSD